MALCHPRSSAGLFLACVDMIVAQNVQGLKRDRRETAVAAKAEKKQRSEGAPSPVSV